MCLKNVWKKWAHVISKCYWDSALAFFFFLLLPASRILIGTRKSSWCSSWVYYLYTGDLRGTSDPTIRVVFFFKIGLKWVLFFFSCLHYVVNQREISHRVNFLHPWNLVLSIWSGLFSHNFHKKPSTLTESFRWQFYFSVMQNI